MDNILRRVQAPSDKYQVLDLRFRFGIAAYQLGSVPRETHPLLIAEREK